MKKFLTTALLLTCIGCYNTSQPTPSTNVTVEVKTPPKPNPTIITTVPTIPVVPVTPVPSVIIQKLTKPSINLGLDFNFNSTNNKSSGPHWPHPHNPPPKGPHSPHSPHGSHK